MAGIYIHVPFCRQACRYCDFYFTVSLKYIEDYVSALLKEIDQRKDVIEAEKINTIYFGGGTPSVLTFSKLKQVLTKINETLLVSVNAEITLEANPDDLSKKYLGELKNAGINRLSIGVQSFYQDDLSLMRRSHSETQSIECINEANSAGFDNINMDLIYGVPGLSMQKWEHNLKTAINLPVKHLSAYHLSYEAGTVFHHWRKKGKLKETEENTSVEQFIMLQQMTQEHGFEHYEISNFAKEGFRSKHNSSYWENKTYLGLGPAAHSFNGKERAWNVSSLKNYIELVKVGEGYNEKEKLSEKDRLNDYLIITLRTKWGANVEYVKQEFGDATQESLLRSAETYIHEGTMMLNQGMLHIKADHWLKADMIIRELIV
ncbi:radical SAM family heme chaperone HemW [Bacteroidota bacterium]